MRADVRGAERQPEGPHRHEPVRPAGAGEAQGRVELDRADGSVRRLRVGVRFPADGLEQDSVRPVRDGVRQEPLKPPDAQLRRHPVPGAALADGPGDWLHPDQRIRPNSDRPARQPRASAVLVCNGGRPQFPSPQGVFRDRAEADLGGTAARRRPRHRVAAARTSAGE